MPLGTIRWGAAAVIAGASSASSVVVKWIAAARRSIRFCHNVLVRRLATAWLPASHGSSDPCGVTT